MTSSPAATPPSASRITICKRRCASVSTICWRWGGIRQFLLQSLHPSRRIAEPVIGRAFARPVGDAPQDEVSNHEAAGEAAMIRAIRKTRQIAFPYPKDAVFFVLNYWIIP